MLAGMSDDTGANRGRGARRDNGRRTVFAFPRDLRLGFGRARSYQRGKRCGDTLEFGMRVSVAFRFLRHCHGHRATTVHA